MLTARMKQTQQQVCFISLDSLSAFYMSPSDRIEECSSLTYIVIYKYCLWTFYAFFIREMTVL